MTKLIERLRAIPTGNVVIGGTILREAADEITHLALDLQTERAAVAALTAELANARAEVHSCGPTCTRAGCVAAGLREDAQRWRTLVANSSHLDYPPNEIGALISPPFRRWYHDSIYSTPTFADAIDAARKAAP